MFTGIIKSTAEVLSIEPRGGDIRIEVGLGTLPAELLVLGDSVCVSGTCLTVAELGAGSFWADVSRETLECTTLGDLTTGARVNLEPSLTPSSAMGGHLVSGHVDGKACLVDRYEDGRSTRLLFEIPASLGRYIAVKGSVCVDGISLTVNEAQAERFSVNIIPHTLAVTTLDTLGVGDKVNLEVDVVARYIERLLSDTRG